MKVLIAGSISIDKYRAFYEVEKLMLVDPTDPIEEFVTGCCHTGPDQVPFLYADILKDGINITKFPANWGKHGKAAGQIRNKQMAEYTNVLILIWDGKSPGSKNMKAEMENLGKPIYEVIIDE
jgi:hypothetical protein